MTRDDALPYVGYCVDDALTERRLDEMPADPRLVRLVGWQCGFEPLFVAVWSYLPDTALDPAEAEEIAADLLLEKKWFADVTDDGTAPPADYVI
jgi:hypothetical protein